VFEYLVKPISRKRFLETLEKARLHLDEQRSLKASRLDGAKQSADTRAWDEKNFLLLITWKALGEKEWEHYRQLLSIESDRGSVLLVGISGVDQSVADAFYPRLAARLSRRYQLFSADYLGKLLLFLPGEMTREELLRFVDEQIGQLSPEGGWVRTGLGGVYGYSEFFRSCGEAMVELGDEVPDDQEGDEGRTLAELRRLVSRAQDLEDVLPRLGVYSDQVFGSCSFAVAKGRMIALFTLLLEDLNRTQGGEKPLPRLFDPPREITSLSSRQEWDAWSARALRTIIEAEQLFREEQLPAVLARAMYYIRGNFEKPLQLTDVARFCGVSPGYLSRLFSEQLRLSFVDYLTSVRLKVAEGLLLENRLPVKEIAFAVGYQDPNYFSRIFRKQKGIAPTSYLQERKDDT
jgi:two-component system response regulator YesN